MIYLPQYSLVGLTEDGPIEVADNLCAAQVTAFFRKALALIEAERYEDVTLDDYLVYCNLDVEKQDPVTGTEWLKRVEAEEAAAAETPEQLKKWKP